jgi:hypothetical protein
VRSSELGNGVAAAFPWADYRAAHFWSRFSLWYLAFDDYHAENSAVQDLPGYLRIAGESWAIAQDTIPSETFDSPFSTVLSDLLPELDAVASKVAASRVRQALRDYFFAAGWEAAIRAGNMPPSPVEYRILRSYSGFFLLNFEFIEHSPRTLLTDSARRDDRMQNIRATACDLATDINDLCSGQYESAHDNAFHPMHPQEGPENDLRERCLNRARTVVEITDATATEPKLHAYCAALCQWVAGTIWWHRRVRESRYRV